MHFVRNHSLTISGVQAVVQEGPDTYKVKLDADDTTRGFWKQARRHHRHAVFANRRRFCN